MLSEVIARARRRLLWNALAFHFAIAVTVALAVLSLLLFLGTDILDWRWLIIVPATPLAAGAWIAFRRLPASYPTAQLVDRRLKLADSLSTALFFAVPNPSRRCDDEARQAQQADATRIAASVDLRQAIPIRFPRASYLAVLPAIVAAGLFDLRYRFDARLDLRPPLAAIVQQLLQDVTSELAKLEDQLQRLLTPDPQKDEEAKKQKSDNGGEEAASIRRMAVPPRQRPAGRPTGNKPKWPTTPLQKSLRQRSRNNSRPAIPRRGPNPIRPQRATATGASRSRTRRATRRRVRPTASPACSTSSKIRCPTCCR